MTDYFDSCLFINTVSIDKVERGVKMVSFSTRIRIEPESTEKSFPPPLFFFGGVGQLGP
jgi:hypothetical protein